MDGRRSTRQSGGYIQQWIEAIESEGFVFLRHKLLRRSHALAFATEEVDADELERRLADDALPLTMVKRSELRGGVDD